MKRIRSIAPSQRLACALVLIIMGLIFLGGCAISHKYGPYYGKVIDAETKQPIEGAVVLVVYKTEQWGLAGSVEHFADAQETLTNKNGEFRISPKRVNTIRVLSGWELHPQVVIFKPGYGCYPKHKDVKPMFIPNGTLPSNQYVTVELPNVKNEPKRARLENYGCYPSPSVPEASYKKLLHLINQEAVSLGLERDREPRGER
jgi:hypothetical protein